MKTFRLLTVFMAATAPAAAQTTNLLETLVSTFTGGDTTRAQELLETLQTCSTASSTSTNLFQDILSASLNATRTCFTMEMDRARARDCADHAKTAVRLATSPYDTFSSQVLTPADIATLATCGEGITTDDEIVSSFQVISKRFLQCDVSYTDAQREAILDVFKGADQGQELSRASLSAVCSTLHFSGTLHRDVVDYVHQTLKHFVVLFPSRRR